MKVDLRTIKRHCLSQTCPQCLLSSDGCCLITDSPPADWDVEAIDRAVSAIGVKYAREAIDRWGIE